jgi:ATP adenylyltransferase
VTRLSRPPIRAEQPSGPFRLWAPWRHAYVGAARPSASRCIFCFTKVPAIARRRRLILHSDAVALVMLNRYPYTNGHLMVAPRRHVASIELLTRAERATIDDLIAHAVVCLRQKFKPSGFNLGANLGRSAGAGFADHLHWHVVPRWEGDCNFMTAISSTRILSRSLEQSFDLLAPGFKAIDTAVS